MRLVYAQAAGAARADGDVGVAGQPSSAPTVTPKMAEHLWLGPAAAIVLALAALACVAAGHNGADPALFIIGYAVDALRAALALAAAALLIFMTRAIVTRQRRPLEALRRSLVERSPTRDHIAAGVIPFCLMPMLLAAFGTLKVLMSIYVPFRQDQLLASWGRTLTGGIAPWRLSHALLTNPWLTVALDRLYTSWIIALPIGFLFFAFAAAPTDRARFFLTSILIWALLGVAGAYIGSSAGPIFLESLGHPEAAQFAGLMARLQAVQARTGVELDCLHWQRVLWDAYRHRGFGFGMGISAMPSLHVAIAWLYVCAGFRIGRAAGVAALAFAALIWLGSFHLGWHYAVDGIASIIAVTAIWLGVDWYLRAIGYDSAIAARLAIAPAKQPKT